MVDSHTLSLTHLTRQPLQPSSHPPLLIMLHGVGSNERDLFNLAPHLDGRFLIVSARAPHVQGPGSYAWFRVQFTPTGPVIDPEQAEASRQAIIRFIGEAVAQYGADPAQVFLMGFSQGAIMSASVALTRPELVAGAALMSGRILPEIGPLLAPPERLSGLPLMVVHGTADGVLPVHNGRASRALLEK
ncbi:MAG: carboxylesterase, partial [Chloroflexota bacterium]|nr:carboxylesterase [Chloroflexota bacterium]